MSALKPPGRLVVTFRDNMQKEENKEQQGNLRRTEILYCDTSNTHTKCYYCDILKHLEK